MSEKSHNIMKFMFNELCSTCMFETKLFTDVKPQQFKWNLFSI